LLFIGIIPLLFIEDYIFRHKERFIKFSVLIYSYPAFLAWNGLTTWWIVNSTGVGAALAIMINALFMAVIFNFFHFSRQKLNNDLAAYTALVCYWIAFEYLHLNWSLNWPWLNLGNGFASYTKWVQWYEFTGAMGGTVWVMLVNVLLFIALKQVGSRQSADGRRQLSSSIQHPASSICLFAAILLILIPIVISLFIYNNYHETNHPVKVVVVQPNVDPYNEQYSLPPQQVIGKIMSLAGQAIDSTTNFLVAPESAIQESMWENDMNTFASLRLLKLVIAKYPGLNIIVGGSTFKLFKNGEQVTATARKFTDSDGYYDAYNTSILLNSRDELQLYHKSKLTPGVESLPTIFGSNPLEKFAINLGGTVGSLGTDETRKVFTTVNTVPVSAAICYESIFGEFFATFVKNGAQVMFIITNDGWWGNTAGHRQHFSFAPLRAIETRRDIARSANTGISAFIDQRGDISQKTKYWVPAVIKGTVNANTKMTFYVIHGDYIAVGAVFMGGLLFTLSVALRFLKKRKINYT
jgi:apolipoprotein N-acyltransferase